MTNEVLLAFTQIGEFPRRFLQAIFTNLRNSAPQKLVNFLRGVIFGHGNYRNLGGISVAVLTNYGNLVLEVGEILGKISQIFNLLIYKFSNKHQIPKF